MRLLNHWWDMKYCPQCAAPLHPKLIEARECLACAQCHWIYWNNPVPAAGCLIEESGKILLILRKNPPEAGKWSLPVGFLHYGESAEQAAAREVEEETGLQVRPVALLGTYSDIIHEWRSHLVLIYRGRLLGGELRPGDDAAEVQWFSVNRLPELAFPSGRSAVEQWLYIRSGPANAVHYCPRCRGALERRLIGNREYPACPTCHYVHFHSPIPVAETVVTDSGGRVLLIKRRLPPGIGAWALPGGHIDFNESAEAAAIREVKEETGLDIKLAGLLCTMGFPSLLNPEQSVLKAVFIGEIVGGDLAAGDDAEDARFFHRHELPENLATESVGIALQKWQLGLNS